MSGSPHCQTAPPPTAKASDAAAAKAHPRGSQSAGRAATQRMDLDRVGQVLAAPAAERHEMQVAPPADRPHHGDTGADPARLGHRLQPRRHVDAVAEHVALVLDHVAEIEPDPQLQGPPGEPVLDRHRGVQGLASAVEHRQEPVARGLEHPPATLVTEGTTTSSTPARRLS